jgi:hypothetical protein
MRQDERIYVGSAIVNGLFRFTSVSQIKLFDPYSEGCHRKFWFAYVKRKKLKKTASVERGADFAEKLEHYLKTDGREDVLPPVLQAARGLLPQPGPDLEVEEPLGSNFPMAVFLRDALLRPEYAHREDIKREIKRLAGLVIDDVPLDGAPDIRHFRDVYISDEGIPCRELPGTYVDKIDDLKTTSRIWPHKILRGENAGKILPGYAKTSAQVCDDAQMLAYARRDCDVFPDVTHFRLGHIYAQTSSRGAARRSGIISREEVLRRWDRVERVFGEMKHVATAERVEDVQPTPSSCDAYTHVVSCGAPGCGVDCWPGSVKNAVTGKHDSCPACKGKGKTAKGCGHRYYCPLSDSVIVQNMIAPYKESAMSLFDTLPPSALPPGVRVSTQAAAPAPPPPVPAAPAATDRSAVETEKAKLLAQDKARAEGQGVSLVGCGAEGCGVGSMPGWVKTHEGGFIMCRACRGRGAVVTEKASVASPPSSPMAVSPPDAPAPPPLIKAADPLPPGEIAKIEDPGLQQVVTAHAQEHAAITAAQEAEAERQRVAAGTNVWCVESGQTIKLTMEMALTKKYVCSCTKPHSTKEAAKQADGSYDFVVPRHKPKNRSEQLALPAAAAPTEADEEAADEEESLAVPPPPPPPLSAPITETRLILYTLQSIDSSLKELLVHFKGGAR